MGKAADKQCLSKSWSSPLAHGGGSLGMGETICGDHARCANQYLLWKGGLPRRLLVRPNEPPVWCGHWINRGVSSWETGEMV
jgi:hypothetical protein